MPQSPEATKYVHFNATEVNRPRYGVMHYALCNYASHLS